VKPGVFHRLARAELDATVSWYNSNRAGLGLDFLAEVERAAVAHARRRLGYWRRRQPE
jgi:hypothetical protein